MAHVYVRSSAAGAGTGADWTNAFTTLAAALTAKAAGDNFWVAEDHAETQASAMTMTSKGTLASPCTIICVNHAGSVPPVSADLATTATITTTGANAMTLTGGLYAYGITFSCGSGAVSSALQIGNNATQQILESCNLWKLGTSSTSGPAIILGNADRTHVIFINVQVRMGSSGDSVFPKCRRFEWRTTGASPPAAYHASSATPSHGLQFSSGAGELCLLEGLDLSKIPSGADVISAVQGNAPDLAIVKNCKLASGALLATASTFTADEAYLIVSDSAGTNYRHEKMTYSGQQSVETTIVRTGGATDGTTPLSWKIVTSANSKWLIPYASIPMAIWNNVTGANVTVSVYGIWGGGAVPNNDDIWIEVSYPGSASTPIATINTANAKANFLATGTGQASDSSTWGGSTTPFVMSVTLSSPQPGLNGPIYVTVKAAKVSSTFYVDPQIVLS